MGRAIGSGDRPGVHQGPGLLQEQRGQESGRERGQESLYVCQTKALPDTITLLSLRSTPRPTP